jgi:hypothetical protein
VSVVFRVFGGSWHIGAGQSFSDHDVVLRHPFHFDVTLVTQSWEFDVNSVAGIVVTDVNIWIDRLLSKLVTAEKRPMDATMKRMNMINNRRLP